MKKYCNTRERRITLILFKWKARYCIINLHVWGPDVWRLWEAFHREWRMPPICYQIHAELNWCATEGARQESFGYYSTIQYFVTLQACKWSRVSNNVEMKKLLEDEGDVHASVSIPAGGRLRKDQLDFQLCTEGVEFCFVIFSVCFECLWQFESSWLYAYEMSIWTFKRLKRSKPGWDYLVWLII